MEINWSQMFMPGLSIVETFVRGTVVYLSLFLLLRFILKRQSGAVDLTDLLVVMLLANASQNAMAGESRSIGDGILLVTTIIFWDFFLDWLGYRLRFVRHLVHPPALPLVKNGQILRRNMRRELVTQEELMSQLREHGVGDLARVREACMEGDGHISVVTFDQPPPSPPKQRKV